MRTALTAVVLAWVAGAVTTSAQTKTAVASSQPGPAWCGTYPGRLRDEYVHHRYIQGLKELRRLRGLLGEAVVPTRDYDDGRIAVIEDDGTLIAEPSPLDVSGLALRFAPVMPSGFDVAVGAVMIETDMGSALGLGDDDSRRVTFGAGFSFPFLGVVYNDVYVNSNGNITFGQGDPVGGFNDFGVFGKVLTDFLRGPPRIAALFADLNPAVRGGVFVKEATDRFMITWSSVPLFGGGSDNTFQITLHANGVVVLAFDAAMGAREGIVGLAPGLEVGGLTPVDFSLGPFTGLTGAIVERFNTQREVDPFAVAKKFYKGHADIFQFLVLMTDFSFNTRGAFAFEVNIANDVLGLGDILGDGSGQDIFNDAALFGSSGALESLLVLENLSKYPSDPGQVFLGTNTTVDLMGQEAGHRWGAFVQAAVDGRASGLLLGRDAAHWSFFHDTDASDLEGNKIRDNGDGSFTTVESTRRFSALDQYLMGLRDASEVAPFFVVTDPTDTTRTASSAPATGVSFRGKRREVRIEDIIQVEGLRRPTPDSSPKIFNMAFVFVAAQGTTPSASTLQKAKAIQAAWESHFAEATNHRGFMDTRLVRDEQPLVTYLPILKGDTRQFTGIAVANQASHPVSTTMTLYADDGRVASLPGIVNPKTLYLGPGQQRALVDFEIFRLGFDEVRQGWVRIDNSSRQVATFFLVGDVAQTYLDGGISQGQPHTLMSFSRVVQGDNLLFNQDTTTEISVVNPNLVGAGLQFRLFDQAGTPLFTVAEEIPSNGRLHKTLNQLFPSLALPITAGHLELSATQPVVGFELVRFGSTLFGLPGQAHTVASRLFSAQLASGGLGTFPAPFFTDLNLVNVGDTPAEVTIRLVGEDGELLQGPGVTNPRIEVIPPKAAVNGRAHTLFGFPRDDADTEIRVGSVIVEVSGGLVLGDVSFGDAANGKIVAALPMQSRLLSDMIFAQVAEGESGHPPVGFYTGLAALNPNSEAVRLEIEVYTENGQTTGGTTLTLEPGHRFSKTLGELVPASAGQLRGFVRVRSYGGEVAMFELFGDRALTLFLASVPPQVVSPTP